MKQIIERCLRLCVAIIVALPAATPSDFKNTAKVALWDFYNGMLIAYSLVTQFDQNQRMDGPTDSRSS